VSVSLIVRNLSDRYNPLMAPLLISWKMGRRDTALIMKVLLSYWFVSFVLKSFRLQSRELGPQVCQSLKHVYKDTQLLHGILLQASKFIQRQRQTIILDFSHPFLCFSLKKTQCNLISAWNKFKLTKQVGFTPSTVAFHLYSWYGVACPFSGASLNFIQMSGMISNLLLFNQHIHIMSLTSHPFDTRILLLSYFSLFSNYLLLDYNRKCFPYTSPKSKFCY
jgi:hypothetical protein